MPLLIVSATLLNFIKGRNVTLDSLSSQLQNFNFCNFFFKISEIKSFSDIRRERFPFAPKPQKIQSIDFRHSVNILFGKISKKVYFVNSLVLFARQPKLNNTRFWNLQALSGGL